MEKEKTRHNTIQHVVSERVTTVASSLATNNPKARHHRNKQRTMQRTLNTHTHRERERESDRQKAALPFNTHAWAEDHSS